MKPSLIALAVLLVCSLTTAAHAQGVQTGALRGTVRDQQELAIPGVTITVSSPALQGQRVAVTGNDGAFTVPLLPPGEYEVHYEIPLFTPVTHPASVPLGGFVEQNITLMAAGITQTVEVVGTLPPPLATPTVGLNLTHEEVEALPTPRDLSGIAQLSPGISGNTPNEGQLIINGAFAFDNAFMVNGVDINDNVFGNPQDLFIEDAIQEIQTLTSGITAEYGRFTGGVVNAITRSGGNTLSGSVRLNLSNPSWTAETPFERAIAIERPDNLNQSWEGTFGGPIVKNRLWFFAAGRFANTATAASLPKTNVSNTESDRNRRGEVKATGTLAKSHTIQIGYLNNHSQKQNVATFPFTVDRSSLISPAIPNWYTVATYRGLIGTRVLAEAQYSERRFSFQNFGGEATSLVDSPIVTLTQDLAQYNAPYFDATDPEARNNRQLTGNVTSFFERAGRHEIKSGYEWFRSQITGGNSPSPTDYVLLADYATDAVGNPVIDSTGHLIPQFVPGSTLARHALSQRGAVLNIDSNSVFVQDHWVINPKLSADLGARFEHASSIALPAKVQGVKTSQIVPRLAAAYDPGGNGDHLMHVTYGWYAGRSNRRLIGGNSNVANPDLLGAVYLGPPGQGRNFAPGFDPANYLTVFGQFPTANVFLDPGLQSPVVREFSVSYGTKVDKGRGYAEGTYVHRRTVNIIEDFIARPNGVTHVVREGVDVGTFTNVVWKSTDLAHRVYDGLAFQWRYTLSAPWTISGAYTLQLRNDGNYEGEAPNQPGLPSQIGDFPEAFTADRSYPDGHLQDFQRHRLRVWSVYDFAMGPIGDLSVSGLWRVDSGRVYSLVASNLPLTDIQLARLAAYPDSPSSQTLFFGERGSQVFDGYHLLDVSINYRLPISRSMRPYVKLDVFNLLDNQKVIAFNTTVSPDPTSPTDALGLPTRYVRSASFGRADDNHDFPIPYAGLTGGRTIRLAIGFRVGPR